MITIFKSIKTTDAPFYRGIDVILDRIKNGNSKDIIDAARKEPDKEKRNEIKKALPAILFSGRFAKRLDTAIIEHSGFICLDFDDFDNDKILNDWKTKLQKDPFIYSLFVSPSGMGLKAVVKIPPETENHKAYFDGLQEHFNTKYFDTKTKNVGRVCYESYDPDIHINENSKTFTNKKEYEHFELTERSPTIKLDDYGEVQRRLVVWWEKKYPLSKGSRNANVFVLASAFNDFGVSKIDAIKHCSIYQQEGFTISEIERVIDSAYSNQSKHGTKYFEDTATIDHVKRRMRSGDSKEEIKADLSESHSIKPQTIDKIITKCERDSSVAEFWSKNKKGQVKIVNHKFKTWIEQEGIFKYYPEDSEHYVYVKRESNLVDNTSTEKIKDVTLSYLYDLEDISIYEYFAEHTKYFKDDYLSLLGNISLDFMEDTTEKAYLYYKNCAVEVGKDYIREIDYLNLNGYVWKKHVIDRNFIKKDSFDCDYSQFITNVAGKDPQKAKSIQSTIGYLLHSFKNRANNVSIILNDEMISENPNGGTGKGIFITAINHMKRTVIIDGKTFNFDNSFPYQTVSADTQLLVFDDIDKKFNFERLFSLITEGITLEKKNKDAIKIPVERSPKILISTNYALKGDGNSFERRKFELEFAQHYKRDYTPQDEFGRLLFDQWDEGDWINFDNYMIHCIQIYLNNGLVESEFNNLETRKFIAKTAFEFYEWAGDNLPCNIRIDKKGKFKEFTDEYKDFERWLTRKRFTQWMEKYAEWKGYEHLSGRSQDGRWIIIKDGKETDIQEEEIDAPF